MMLSQAHRARYIRGLRKQASKMLGETFFLKLDEIKLSSPGMAPYSEGPGRKVKNSSDH